MNIDLKQVIRAVEEASDIYTLYFDTESGETVYLADSFVTGESSATLEDLIENQPGRFLRFPSKYDIHEYSIMESFIESLPHGRAKEELLVSIRRKGAFRRFKQGIHFHRLEQMWYVYRTEAFREIAVRWCEDHALEFEN